MSTRKAATMEISKLPTRIALIEKAEELFAQSGVDAVSLRQIGAAIGSSNTNVVGYHFGNKDALITAVFEYRIPSLETQREKLLKQLDDTGEGDRLLPLLRAFWLPLFDQVNEAGIHSYARFLGTLIRSGNNGLRHKLAGNHPATNEIMRRIRLLIPAKVTPFREERWQLSVLLVTDALRMIDETPRINKRRQREIFEDTLLMSEAANMAGATSKG